MNQITVYKTNAEGEVRSMVANDAPGARKTLEKDGWSLTKPKGYVEPEAEAAATIEELTTLLEDSQAANEGLIARVQELEEAAKSPKAKAKEKAKAKAKAKPE